MLERRNRMVAGRLRLARCIVAGWFALAAVAAAAQPGGYILQAGDTVRIAVIGMTELSVDATINQNGALRLPQLGDIGAAGLTIDELEASVRTAVVGRVFSVRRGVDDMGVVTIRGEDLYLTIVGYRPVTIAGDVRTPDVLEFRPGMTLRSALADVGGVGTAPAAIADAFNPGQLSRLQAEFTAATLERAQLLALRWRIRSELGLADAAATPQLGVDAAVASEMIETQRDILSANAEEREQLRSFRIRSAEQIALRLDILRQQEENLIESTEDDAAELARVQRLRDDGIVPIQRLLEIRRAQLLSTSRLLETQNTIERVNQEMTRLEFDEAADTAVLRRTLLTELSQAEGRLRELEIALSALQDELQLSGLLSFTGGPQGRPPFTCRVYRRTAAGPVGAPIRLDDFLSPGDVVEIAVQPPTLAPWDSLSGAVDGAQPTVQPRDCADAAL